MSKKQLKRPPTTPKRCIFCGRTGLSEEHIWPVWSHEFIRPKSGSHFHMRRLQTARGQSTEKQLVSEIKHDGDITSMRFKIVCEHNCNNGWMSRLEERAKPIIIPLLRGTHIALTKPNQELLATWIATKLLTLECTTPDVVTPALERSLLMGRRRPPDIMQIWIGHCADGPATGAYYRHAQSAPVRVPFGGLMTVLPKAPNLQAQTFIIGQLFVQAITTTAKGLEFDPPSHLSHALRKLWPYQHGFAWPLPAPLSFAQTSELATALERTSFPLFPRASPGVTIPRARL